MAKAVVLNKQQQKNTLKAKKVNKKIICALNSPYENYYPLLNPNDHVTLNEILNKCLLKLNREKVKIPWTLIKKLPKEEKKKFKEKYIMEKLGVTTLPPTKMNRDGLLLGINEVTKGIEKQQVKSVLIASDIKPWIMVEHVINQAAISKIPVLVVPDLRNILKEKCNISSTSIAFNDSIKYKPVQEAIEKIYLNYPVPNNYMYLNRMKSENCFSISSEENTSAMPVSTTTSENIEMSSSHNSTDEKQEINEMEMKNVDSETRSAANNNDHVYLYRINAKQRVFVPKIDPLKQAEFKNKTISEKKIYEKMEEQVNNYCDIKIKKIKGDPNRNKRKIEKLKMNKKKKKL